MFHKFIKKTLKKIWINFLEKQYKYENHILKYVLEKHKSNILIVVFSGFASKNETSKYNYMRTLKDIKANKLFILDDFGFNKRGSYYLGENKDFFVEKGVDQLIELIKNKLNISKVILLGSSKGGSAALYFGFKHHADCIISGAPQFYYGNYLDTELHRDLLKSIMGNTDKNSVNELNSVLPNVIRKGGSNAHVYVHCSKYDHMYEEHFKYLITALDSIGCKYICDIADYKGHSTVAEYFPNYILNTLKKEIS